MDIGLGDASAFLERWGFPVFVSVVSLGLIGYIVGSFSNRIAGLTQAISKLTDKVSAPYLDVPHSMIVYRSIIKEAITEQIKFIGDILYANNLELRAQQIRDNLRKEFARINSNAASKLSGFKSVSGDMGKYYLEKTDMTALLNPIYAIIFGTSKGDHKAIDDHRKIEDIKTHLFSHMAEIGMELEQNGVSN